jgi:hypothetical protein
VSVRSHTVLKNRVKRHGDMAFLAHCERSDPSRRHRHRSKWILAHPDSRQASHRFIPINPRYPSARRWEPPRMTASPCSLRPECISPATRPAGRRVRFRGLCCRRRALALSAGTRQLKRRDGSAGKSARRRRAVTAISRLSQLPIALPWRQGLDSRGSPRWLTVTVAPGRDFNWTRCSSPRKS